MKAELDIAQNSDKPKKQKAKTESFYKYTTTLDPDLVSEAWEKLSTYTFPSQIEVYPKVCHRAFVDTLKKRAPNVKRVQTTLARTARKAEAIKKANKALKAKRGLKRE